MYLNEKKKFIKKVWEVRTRLEFGKIKWDAICCRVWHRDCLMSINDFIDQI